MENLKQLDDNQLILKIKTEFCNESMEILIDRHNQLYYSTVHRFFKKHPNSNLQDLLDDLYIVINKCIEKYDINKNTKFSTFISYMTYWHCQNINKDNFNTQTYENKDIDLINESNNKYQNFEGNINDLNNHVLGILKEMDDPRASKLFELRFIQGSPKGDKVMSVSYTHLTLPTM
jgi:hypothetical protein